jgi:hypothetical protein
MLRMRILPVVALALSLWPAPAQTGDKGDGGVTVDKDKRLIRIDAKVAPRKIDDPRYKEIYPIEVIACWPFPRGQKAHETVVTIEAKPSAVHKALVDFGLKPGTPRFGEGKEPPLGPECKIHLEMPDAAGEMRRVPIDRTLVDKKTGKPFPKSVTWRFTGSVRTKPDPNKAETVYGADRSGTLITIFPVTNEAVFQTNLTMEYEHLMKLETNPKVLPKVGTPVKLVIEVPQSK